MKNLMKGILFCLVLIALGSGCAGKLPSGTSVDSASETGLPAGVDPKALQPGLDVFYRYGFWRNISQMPGPESFLKNGRSGKVVNQINHQFGTGEVFDSGKTRGVGVQIQGFIKLSHEGLWHFKARSNDGIDIKISQVQVVFDPGVHSDRFSRPEAFNVSKPGWYPLMVRYFQRKGTATLEFFWKPPGEEDFSIIPEEAYRH